MKNQEHWKAKRFVRDKKGRIIGTYNHKIIGNAYEPVIRKYARGRLGDVGCGDVPYYIFYKDIVSETICVDWGNSRLDISHLDFEADLNEGLGFLESNSFDTVLCSDVLEHIRKPELLFSEMIRILKPGGHLILTVPFLYWLHETPHDHHRYTEYKLKDFCATNNAEAVELFPYGGLPEVLFDLVSKGYRFGNFPMQKPFFFFWNGWGKFLSRRRFVKKISERTKRTFPLGYVLVARKAG
ncbi:MAG: methyltransferase domain-containing protein [Bacteroidia bacterium]|jgi:SAM-dependent methyltransferase|nr:methyltransferase domain-containing protein [Bacteroidia bacterium]